MLALTLDGKDVSVGTPWDSSVVIVSEFREYDFIPFVMDVVGRVFRMRPSKDSSRGYRLEETNMSLSTDALFKGFVVPEKRAVELL